MNMHSLALLTLPLCMAAIQSTEEKPLTRDETLLAKAEKRYEQGRYKDAWRAYKALAKEFPDTPAGKVGARRSQDSCYLGTTLVVGNGPQDNRFDVAIMGDGYKLDKQKGFDKLVDKIPDVFENQRTFDEYFSYFNFHRVNLISKDDGLDGHGRVADTALDGQVADTFAGHATVDRNLVFQMLAEMGHHDSVAIVFVKAGALGMSSGGVATVGGRSDATTIHEFGHAFANLGDEYTAKTHERGGVPTRANVSRTDDPEKVPWAHWIAAKVPGIGVYQGAAGQERGAWKPTPSGCVMEGGANFFCRPCREAIILRIYGTVDGIEQVAPDAHGPDATDTIILDEPFEFSVRVMTPSSHRLEVSWWVLPFDDAPNTPVLPKGEIDRRKRGPLPPIAAKPVQTRRNSKTGEYSLRLTPRTLEPGRYRVVVRAIDRTMFRGDRWPWVLEDPRGVLESERGWNLVVPGS